MLIEESTSGVRIAIAGRASYFHGLVATPDDSDKPEQGSSFKSAILIPKDSPKQAIAVVLNAIKKTVQIGIKKKWNGTKPSELRLPWRNGDEKAADDKEKYEAYAGNYHMTAKKRESQGQPSLKAYGKKVEANGVIESGDWCLFDITFYPFNNKSKGVAVALNGVTLIEEGERFSGGPSGDSIDKAAQDLYGDDIMGMPEGEDDDLMGGMGDLDDLMGGGDDDLAGLEDLL